MTTPRHIAYLRPYEKNGRTRVWIEGRRVADSGFNAGAHFSVSYAKGVVELTLNPEGKGKKVHAKTRNGGAWPIIDIFNENLAEALSGASRFKAEFHDGVIRIIGATIATRAITRIERLLGTATANKPLLGGSLFHGLGVLDHAIHKGLAAAGIPSSLAFAVERDPTGLDASLANNPLWQDGGLAILGDIQDIDVTDLPKVDILCAGIPCQGASPQGRTSLKLQAPEHHPEVGHLFLSYLRVVEATEPSILVIENVPNYRNSIGCEMIRRQLSNLGYALEETTLSGPDVGAIENRKRLVMIARSAGVPEILPNLPGMATSNLRLGNILEAVAGDSPLWKRYEHVKQKLLRDAVKPRNGMKANVLTPDAELVPAIIKGYAETKSWQPYVAHPTQPDLMRKFTAIEHCRIKGVPERLIAGLPETVAHGLLGQSVIHAVFETVGRAIGKTVAALRPSAGQLRAA